jgi:GH43 family beta-xylosidase
MTPLEHNGKLYAIWSGWDGPETDRQFLYIAAMASPIKLSSRRVRICNNQDYPWEKTEAGASGRGLNEGPQVLKHHHRSFVIYSCGASWLPSYKLGQLELTGDNPLDPSSWKKRKHPVFQSSKETVGVGHSCFIKSPDGSEWGHIFHAKRDSKPGWRRAIFVQPFKWHKDGRPRFGRPSSKGEHQPRPAGEETSMHTLPYKSELRAGHSFYGHHQFYQITNSGLKLGSPPSGLRQGFYRHAGLAQRLFRSLPQKANS